MVIDSIPHRCHKERYCKQLSPCTELKGVWPRKCMEIHVAAAASANVQIIEKVIIIWSFTCLIVLEAKCHLCKGIDFIVL